MGTTVRRALRSSQAEMGYGLQANMKTLEEGASHPGRDLQFQYLNERVRRFLKQGEPVIAVDTRGKELIGQDYDKGRWWRPGGSPEKVKVHDFIDPDEPKAIPYGLYDVARNQGWVSVGCDHGTASFAVGSIRRWWSAVGSQEYPQARRR